MAPGIDMVLARTLGSMRAVTSHGTGPGSGTATAAGACESRHGHARCLLHCPSLARECLQPGIHMWWCARLGVYWQVGVLRIVEIPRNLRRPMQSERKAMAAFLDREGERVADVEVREGGGGAGGLVHWRGFLCGKAGCVHDTCLQPRVARGFACRVL